MSKAIQRKEAPQMTAIVIGAAQIKLTPQQSSVLDYVRKSPGQTIREIHEDLGYHYESVRTALVTLLKHGLVETRGNRPQYLSPFYVTETTTSQARTGLSA
jgi:DNA-binding MarR family transcriptional regulator